MGSRCEDGTHTQDPNYSTLDYFDRHPDPKPCTPQHSNPTCLARSNRARERRRPLVAHAIKVAIECRHAGRHTIRNRANSGVGDAIAPEGEGHERCGGYGALCDGSSTSIACGQNHRELRVCLAQSKVGCARINISVCG